MEKSLSVTEIIANALNYDRCAYNHDNKDKIRSSLKTDKQLFNFVQTMSIQYFLLIITIDPVFHHP